MMRLQIIKEIHPTKRLRALRNAEDSIAVTRRVIHLTPRNLGTSQMILPRPRVGVIAILKATAAIVKVKMIQVPH